MAHAKDYDGAIVALQSIVGSYAIFTQEEILGYDGATYDFTRALLELGSLYFATGQVIFVTHSHTPNLSAISNTSFSCTSLHSC
jgi:hypothetical protein